MASISVGQNLSGVTITINQILPTTEMPTPEVNGQVGEGDGYFDVWLYGDQGDDWVSCGGILKSASYVIAYGGLYIGAGGHTTTKWSVFTDVEYDSVIVTEITNEVGFTFTLPEDFGAVTQIPTNTTYLDRLSFDVSDPTPDWSNSFIKTSSGNKAVEKVWIKQNGQLVTVWDGGGGGGAAVDFATDSWETISAACKDGSYKTVYSVGDTKDIELSTGETITVAIMGFDHDDLADGSGKAPITLGMTELLATIYRMKSTDTNAGGWDESEMRTSTMTTLLTKLPSDLQSVIKQVNKKATAGNQSTSITTSADKLWLLAEVEVDGTTTAGYADEGEQYEYWKTVKDGKNYSDRIKKESNGSGSLSDWWLRTPSLNYKSTFRKFGSGGYLAYGTATFREGVSFGFCVG